MADEHPEPGRLAVAATWALFASLAVGTLVLVSSVGPTDPAAAHERAATGFLERWERYRTGTFVLRGTFERETPSGTLSSPYVLAQRPPQRTIFQFGGVEAAGGGAGQRCELDPEGVERCSSTGEGLPYDAAVRAELDALADYFFGTDPPLYEVVEVDGCFQLVLRRAMELAPYGYATTFCFDDASGALVELIQQRERGVDHVLIEDVRTDVSDGDLVPELSVAAG